MTDVIAGREGPSVEEPLHDDALNKVKSSLCETLPGKPTNERSSRTGSKKIGGGTNPAEDQTKLAQAYQESHSEERRYESCEADNQGHSPVQDKPEGTSEGSPKSFEKTFQESTKETKLRQRVPSREDSDDKQGKESKEKKELESFEEDATWSKLQEINPPVEEFNQPDDTETDPDGGLVKYWNLAGPGPLAIAKSIKKRFGPTGGIIEIGDCRAEFRPRTFKAETEVTVTAIIDSSKWPPNFICFTPILDVNAPGLEKPVYLHLPSWCVDNNQRNAKAQIMHKPQGSQWEDTGKVLPVTDDPFFEFEWPDFCEIVVGATPFNTDPLSFRISGAVFCSDRNEMTVALIAHESLTSRSVIRQMMEPNPPRRLKVPFNPIENLDNRNILEIKLQFDPPTPEDFWFNPPGPFLFTVHPNIFRDMLVKRDALIHRGHQFQSSSAQEEVEIWIGCTVNTPRRSDYYPFTYTYSPGQGARTLAPRVSQAQTRASTIAAQEVSISREKRGDVEDELENR